LALAAWPEIQVQFLPKYAYRLNLTESWGKPLRALALKGRRFDSVERLIDALTAVDYWNPHAHPYVWESAHKDEPFSTLSALSALPVHQRLDYRERTI
jgi:hypothetical protein